MKWILFIISLRQTQVQPGLWVGRRYRTHIATESLLCVFNSDPTGRLFWCYCSRIVRFVFIHVRRTRTTITMIMTMIIIITDCSSPRFAPPNHHHRNMFHSRQDFQLVMQYTFAIFFCCHLLWRTRKIERTSQLIIKCFNQYHGLEYWHDTSEELYRIHPRPPSNHHLHQIPVNVTPKASSLAFNQNRWIRILFKTLPIIRAKEFPAIAIHTP